MKTSREDLLSPPTERTEYPESDAGTRISESTTTTVTTSGGLLAAFLASLCCLGPLVLAALGVGVGATGVLASTAGTLKALLPYRPYFIGLTAVLFGVAFYFSYRRPTADGRVRTRFELRICHGDAPEPDDSMGGGGCSAGLHPGALLVGSLTQ